MTPSQFILLIGIIYMVNGLPESTKYLSYWAGIGLTMVSVAMQLIYGI